MALTRGIASSPSTQTTMLFAGSGKHPRLGPRPTRTTNHEIKKPQILSLNLAWFGSLSNLDAQSLECQEEKKSEILTLALLLMHVNKQQIQFMM